MWKPTYGEPTGRKLRALFFGTPAFAVPSLQALAEIADVVGVVCQPDKPVGRGLTLTPPPVKATALELGLPVVQPTKLRTGDFAAWVSEANADVALVVAYGRILPKDVIEIPRTGCVNVHASLLPKYRGAAPVAWSIVRGETETGVTLMLLDEGMDTGDTLAFSRTPIDPNETTAELSDRLSRLGAVMVKDHLLAHVRGDLIPEPQDEARATMAPPLRKEDGRVDWKMGARHCHDHVRGMNPWPGATTKHGEKTVKIHETRLADVARPQAAPGEVILADKSRLLVSCGDGRAVELVQVQLEGRKAVRGVDWVMGRGVKEGDTLA